jgi:polar amino acid transport system ATP-binding protein
MADIVVKKPPMLSVRGLWKRFGNLEVLKGIDLDLSAGEVVSVIGPSGSGKSTLLRCINALEKPEAGAILIEGRALAGPERRAKTGMIFQRFNLFPHLTVLENLMEAPLRVKGLPRSKAQDRALELLERMALSEKRDAYPSRLSGGQQQRVAIARALCMDPEILLCDEPTSALDPELVGEVLEVLSDLATRRMTMIVVTHEMEFARVVSDRIVFMDGGSVLEEGKPEQVLDDPESPRLRAFLEKMPRR